MRILIVVHGYPPTHAGGAELRAQRTARSLTARGYQVCVLCVESTRAEDDAPRHQDSIQDGILVRRLFIAGQPASNDPRGEYANPETAQALARLVHDWRPAVIHLFSGYLMTSSIIDAANALGVPTVVSLTDFWWLCHRITLLRANGSRCAGPTPEDCARCGRETYRRFRLPAAAWPQAADMFWRLSSQHSALRERLGMSHYDDRLRANIDALNRAGALIAPSQYLADVYGTHGVDTTKIRVWRQGVDIDRCLTRTSSPDLRIGYLGQVKRHKGVDLLVEAWSMLRGPVARSLVIYGSDNGEPAYGKQLRQRMAAAQGARWQGPISREDVWTALANLDVVVVPSRWVENSPNIILESQAVGVVVVGTNLGGVAELVRHEDNGLLFEPGSATDLAAKLQRLLDDPSLLDRLRQGVTAFQSHTAEIDTLESLYASLADPAQLADALVSND